MPVILNKIYPALLSEGGLSFHIYATKPSDLNVKSAKIHLDGDSFWDSLPRVLGTEIAASIKSAHPFPVNEDIFDLGSFTEGAPNDFDFYLFIGRGSQFRKPFIRDRLERLSKQQGDPSVSITARYGKKYKKILWNFETKASSILCAEPMALDLLRSDDCVPLEDDVDQDELLAAEEEKRERLLKVIEKRFGTEESESSTE
ncbi:hypothetical protein PROFUN_15649, partial [Planoprotostelium fungivorum]